MSDLVRPRVRLTYAVESEGELRTVEMPFVVGVLADLSGHGSRRLPLLAEREFVTVERGALNRLMAEAAPQLTLRVPDCLTDSRDQFDVDLSFRNFSDFFPLAVARQIPFLRTMIDNRKGLGDSDPRLAEIDQRLSHQLLTVLHHPEFRRLEGAWLGLAYLAAAVPADANVRIKVLNVDRPTLAHDFAQADGFDQSALFQKVYDEPYGTVSGEPIGLLLGDYEFSHSAADVGLLRNLAGVAEFALAPLVAGADPKLLGLPNFADLQGRKSPAKVFEKPEYAPWRSFRESEEARFVGLTLPHVLGRPHYDSVTHAVADFDFDEGVAGTEWDRQLLQSAAWAFAGRVLAAFVRHGWFMRCCGRDGGTVDELPGLALYESGRSHRRSTDAVLHEMAETELSGAGFLTLTETTGQPVFLAAASCQKPKQYHDAKVTAHAAKGAKLNYLLSLLRFPQLVKVLARAKFGSFDSVKACERWLNDRLGEYVLANPNAADEAACAARPLREAKIEIKKVEGSAYYHAMLHLRPHFQSEDQDFFMRLGTEIPLRL